MNTYAANNTCNQTDENLSDLLLDQHHYEMLRASAISDHVIRDRGYKSIKDPGELKKLGFSPAQCRVPGLLIPLHTTDGQVGLYVYRPDNPRVIEDKSRKNADGTHPNKVLKYELPKGSGVRLDCPPSCLSQLADPNVPLWITEGQKKADALASIGLCAIALLGVWSFKGKNSHEATTILADWDYVALKNREVRIIFDSDVMTKPAVRLAIDRLTEHLKRKGSKVSEANLPHDPKQGKIGVDDWLAAGHTLEELTNLIAIPRQTQKPAPDTIELLDSPPNTISRPLSLLDGHSYTVTWLYVQRTQIETVNKKGEIVSLNPPISTTEQLPFIIRDDGMIYGDTGNPMENLNMKIHLPEIPPANKLWSPSGVKKYRAGNRVQPPDVFSQLVDVVDNFIDFERSLAPQREMCEFIACYILSTWFLDAFNVTGFLWPNGERGSGKTQLLLIIAELAYLGELILASGSFASLRDFADYGATLAFDDAEKLADPKNDPDKRALLLAGNRRGVTVPVKEQGPDKTWHTRRVNAFCPRLFSGIYLPDPILSSRTIIIPLIRTPDRKRANVDPQDFSTWPRNRDNLVDDLWALVTEHLPKLSWYDKWVGTNTKLHGRNLQPWRSILAVAKWLEECGVDGLFDRMEYIAMEYQKEKHDIQPTDFTILVVKSIISCAINSINASRAVNPYNIHIALSAAEVAQRAYGIAKDEEANYDESIFNSRSVGRVMSKLRLRELPRPGGKGPRRREISLKELFRLIESYELEMPLELRNIAVSDTYSSNNSDSDGSTDCDESAQTNLSQSLPVNTSFNAGNFTQLSLPCYACGSVNWQTYPDGSGFFCATCHPSPTNANGKLENATNPQ